MSLLPLQLNLPMQQLRKYLRMYLSVAEQSADDWSSAETATVKIGDVYTLFKPARLFAENEDMSELEVDGVAVVFREDAGFPMNYFIDDNSFEMSFMEGTLSQKATEARELGLSFYCFHSTLARPLTTEAGTAIGGMHKWGGSGERLKAPHGLPDPLYFFLTSLGLAVEPTLAREALPVKEFVLSLWNPQELASTSRAPNASDWFVPMNEEGQPVFEGSNVQPEAAEPEVEKPSVDYGAMSFSALLDDLSTVPGATDTGNGGNGSTAEAQPPAPAPAAETTEQSSLSALLEKVSGVSSQATPTASVASNIAELEEDDDSLDLSKLENALKDLVTNQSQPVKTAQPEAVKPAEGKPARKGQIGPQFEDSEGAWEMLKAKPKDEFPISAEPSAPMAFNVQAAETGPDLGDGLDFSAALAAELNQEVNLALPGAEESKASKGMEPWPSDFAAALKAELSAEEPVAEKTPTAGTKGMEPWPSDFAAALKAELAAEEPAESKPAATKGMEPWPSDFAAALKAELAAPESNLSFEQVASNASANKSPADAGQSVQGMEPWPSDFAAALAAELSSEINLGGLEGTASADLATGSAEPVAPVAAAAPAAAAPPAANNVAPLPVQGGTFAGGLDSLLTASAPSKPAENPLSAFELKKAPEPKAPAKKDDKLVGKPASKLDAMVQKQGLSQTNSKLLGGSGNSGGLLGANANAQKPGLLGMAAAKPESKLSKLSQPAAESEHNLSELEGANDLQVSAESAPVLPEQGQASNAALSPNLTPGFFAAAALAAELEETAAPAAAPVTDEIPSFLLNNSPSANVLSEPAVAPTAESDFGMAPFIPGIDNAVVAPDAVANESVHNPPDSLEPASFIPETSMSPETSLTSETAADLFTESPAPSSETAELSPEALADLSMGAAASEFIGELEPSGTEELSENLAAQLASELGFDEELAEPAQENLSAVAEANQDESSISLEPPEQIDLPPVESGPAFNPAFNPADTHEDLPALPAIEYGEEPAVPVQPPVVPPIPQSSSMKAPAKPSTKLDFSKSRMFGNKKKTGKPTSEEKKVELADLLNRNDAAALADSEMTMQPAAASIDSPANTNLAEGALAESMGPVAEQNLVPELASMEPQPISATPEDFESTQASALENMGAPAFEDSAAIGQSEAAPGDLVGAVAEALPQADNFYQAEMSQAEMPQAERPQAEIAHTGTVPLAEASSPVIETPKPELAQQAPIAAVAPAAAAAGSASAALNAAKKAGEEEEDDDESRPQKKLSLQATLSKLEDQSQRAQIRLAEFKEAHEVACSDDARNIKVQSEDFEKSINATLLIARESIRNKFQSLVDEAGQRLKGLISDGQSQIQGSLPQAHADLDVIAAEANIEVVQHLLEESFNSFNDVYQSRFSSIESDLKGSLTQVLDEELSSLKNWRDGELKSFTNSFEQILSRVEQHRIASLSALESCVHSLQEELKRLQEIDLERLALLNSELGETLEQSCKLAEMRLTRDCDIALAEKIMPLLAEWKSNLGIHARNLRIEIEEYLESHSETSLSEFEPVLALGKEAVTLIVSNVSELQENIEGPEKEAFEVKYQELSSFFEGKISSLANYFDEQKQKKQDGVTHNESNNAQKIDKIGDTSLGKIAVNSANAQGELFKQADNFVDSYDKRAEDICIASVAEMNNDLEVARNLRRESLRRLQDRLNKLSSTVQAVQAQLIQ